MVVRRIVVLLLVLVGMQGVSASPALARDPVRLTFDKTAVAAGVWEGTISGDIEATLQTVLLIVDQTGPIWHVMFDWIIGSGERSFTARLDGVLNTQTGAVVMDGSVTDGYLLGARVHETGRLVDSSTSRFTGFNTMFAATQG